MALIDSKPKRNDYTRADDEQIVTMKNQGKTTKEIADAVKRSPASITYRINKVLKKKDDYSDIKYKEKK